MGYTSHMLSTVRERLTLLLLALLPLHAFGMTVLTRVLAGPNHAPLSMVAMWKEIWLVAILLVATFEIMREVAGSGWRVAVRKFDALDISIFLALFYSILLHPWGSDTAVTSYIYGFRYDFVPLIAFLILRRVSWSDAFWHLAKRLLIFIGALVSAYGLLTLVLPDRWFMWLGYSSLHSLYLSDGPIAAFQFISESGIRRMQSTFSGPNQMGLWLLIPLSFALSASNIRRAGSGWRLPAGQAGVAGSSLILLAILFSFSRAAWIGALVIVFLHYAPRMQKKTVMLSSLVVLTLGVVASLLFPSVLLRSISSSAHITRPIAAVQTILAHPLGRGLGSAGPASNRISDTCVELPLGADASWAADRPDLCVFVGGEKVQPLDQECSCPVLPENWYLQWGVEMGVLGLILSALIPFLVLRKRVAGSGWRVALDAFIAISVAALFLHAFEDSAVSYTLWILLSGTLPLWKVSVAPSSSSISADNMRT